MKSIVIFSIVLFIHATFGSREKRFVLDSNTDIATEMLKLRSEMQTQKTIIASLVATFEAEIQKQTTTLKADLLNKMATLRAELLHQNDTFTEKLQNETTTIKAKLLYQNASFRAELKNQTAMLTAKLLHQNSTFRKELHSETIMFRAELLRQNDTIRTEFLNETSSLRGELLYQTDKIRTEHLNETTILRAKLLRQNASFSEEIKTESAKFRTELLNIFRGMLRAGLYRQNISFQTELQNTTATIFKYGAELLNQTDNIRTELLNEIANHDNFTARLQEEIASLNASNTKLTDEFSNEQLILRNDTFKEHVSVYVRWGRPTCPGYMAGAVFKEYGNGANHLCLPEDPQWANFSSANDGQRANIHGSKFQENGRDFYYFGKYDKGQSVLCAVCMTTGVSVMIPARTSCYPGWNLEYSGYLMAARSDIAKSEYVCVDAVPDFEQRPLYNGDENFLYLVQSICGALPSPPYYSYKELTCCVCSK